MFTPKKEIPEEVKKHLLKNGNEILQDITNSEIITGSE